MLSPPPADPACLECGSQNRGRWAQWDAPISAQVEYIQGAAYDELRFGQLESHTFTANSVLLIPNLLSEPERQLLLAASEKKAEDIGKTQTASRLRMSVLDHTKETNGHDLVHGGLGPGCTALWDTILNERLLPFLAAHVPSVEIPPAPEIQYAGSEPSVNRYLAGGDFKSHTDDEAVTVNCLLSNGGFVGGGTEFWADDGSSGLFNDDECTVRLHPDSGVGVLFHGDMWHAGTAVSSGVRYLLVASFSNQSAPIRAHLIC